MFQIVQGDDVIIGFTCPLDGTPIAISSSATVKACLVSNDTAYGQITCLEADSEADWANGVVGIVWPRATSALFPLGTATIEVEVTDTTAEQTWYKSGCRVVKKHIT